MDVISFLLVLIGSSTAQLHDSPDDAHVQRLVSVVKMATVLWRVTSRYFVL
jgi:hypothetical protein